MGAALSKGKNTREYDQSSGDSHRGNALVVTGNQRKILGREEDIEENN